MINARTMPMSQKDDTEQNEHGGNSITPSSKRVIPKPQTAVALTEQENKRRAPLISAAGRGKIAEKILQLAYENDVKVRTDADLAELLAKIEIDSPIPSEAFGAVAEILSYVYRANGERDPFQAVLPRFEEDDHEQ